MSENICRRNQEESKILLMIVSRTFFYFLARDDERHMQSKPHKFLLVFAHSRRQSSCVASRLLQGWLRSSFYSPKTWLFIVLHQSPFSRTQNKRRKKNKFYKLNFSPSRINHANLLFRLVLFLSLAMTAGEVKKHQNILCQNINTSRRGFVCVASRPQGEIRKTIL